MSKKGERAAYWRGKVEEQASSGLPIAAFCRKKGLTAGTFSWWKYHLRGRRPGRASEGFVELVARGPEIGYSGVEVRIGERLCIRLARGFDPETLKTALAALADEGR